MLKAGDIMTRDVISVRPETTVKELAGILIEHHISGVPVVGEDKKLLGIVTENDLIKKEKRLHIPTVMRIFDAFVYLESSKRFEEDLGKMVATKVEEIYTKDVVTVEEETAVSELATIMTERDVHLLPVMSGGEVVGVVGNEDIIRAITRG